MTDTPPSNPPAVEPQVPPAGNKSGPFKVYETEKQYQDSLNRKLSNYVPKAEYQTAIERASSLEKAIAEANGKNSELENTVAQYQIAELRLKIGRESGLPPEWADELKGTDEKSIREHADSLRKKLGVKNTLGLPIPPNANSAAGNSFNQELLRAFGRGGR
jgi:hypothetical protein